MRKEPGEESAKRYELEFRQKGGHSSEIGRLSENLELGHGMGKLQILNVTPRCTAAFHFQDLTDLKDTAGRQKRQGIYAARKTEWRGDEEPKTKTHRDRWQGW